MAAPTSGGNRYAATVKKPASNWIKGILNNVQAPVLPPEEKPLDKAREIPPKRRSREREER